MLNARAPQLAASFIANKPAPVWVNFTYVPHRSSVNHPRSIARFSPALCSAGVPFRSYRNGLLSNSMNIGPSWTASTELAISIILPTARAAPSRSRCRSRGRACRRGQGLCPCGGRYPVRPTFCRRAQNPRSGGASARGLRGLLLAYRLQNT